MLVVGVFEVNVEYVKSTVTVHRTSQRSPRNPLGHWQLYVTDDVARQVPPL